MYHVSTHTLFIYRKETDMVNFKNNVTVVIATHKRYRYGPRAIQISMGCYNALNESMAVFWNTCFWTGKALDMTVPSPMCGLKQLESVSLEKAFVWQGVHMRCMTTMSAWETSCPRIGGSIQILNTTGCRHGVGPG